MLGLLARMPKRKADVAAKIKPLRITFPHGSLQFECAASISEGIRSRNPLLDCTVRRNPVDLAPVLQFGPELGERTEFRSAANENADPLLQRVGIIRRGADVLNVLKKLLEAVWAIVQNNHAIAGISARSPQKVGLIAA